LKGRGDWQQRWDFRGDPDHDADPRIFKGILPLRDRNSCTNFADNSKKLLTNCESFWGWGGMTTRNKSFAFDADENYGLQRSGNGGGLRSN